MLVSQVLGKDASALKISIEGIIDESADFKQLIPSTDPVVHIHCGKIARINSVGVKLWGEYFKAFRASGRQVRFFELSPVLVSTMNYISSFIQKPELVSLCVPYLCEGCQAVNLKTITPDEARSKVSELGSTACSKCGKTAELDATPEEYFSAILE